MNQGDWNNPERSLSDFESLGFKKVTGALIPPPLEKPPFTLKQIRDAIPAHCFDRSLTRSMAHLIFDIVIVFSLYYLSISIPNLPFSALLRIPLWLAYFYVQALFLMGLIVIGHECGHGAFSPYPIVNDVMGWIAHSLCFVPYIIFKAGHRSHHQFANTCDHDEFFIRPTRSQAIEDELRPRINSSFISHWHHALEEIPVYNLVRAILDSVDFYVRLACGKSRLEKFKGKKHYGFWLDAEIYAPHHETYKIPLLVSYIGCLLVFAGHAYHIFYYGYPSYLLHIGIPTSAMFIIFTLMTLLHHTDVYVPRYRDPEWTWLRGNLSTVDRSNGSFFDFVTHHGAHTHVVHHLFPKMPFYHTVEATEAIKGVLGKYYLRDDTPIFEAALRVYKNCKFIEDEGPVVFSKRDLDE